MALLLSACAMTPPQPAGTVEVADIVNSVKCGLAEAMRSESGRRRLPGSIATVELQLKVVDGRTLGANTPGAVPLVLTWATGLTVAPILGASASQTYTVDTTINLSYRLDQPNVTLCQAPGIELTDRFGFARWLGDIIAGLSKVSHEGPRGTLDRLTYDATFAVTRDVNVGAGVKIILVDASATTGRSRSDVQRLKIVISGPNALAAGLESVGGAGRSRSTVPSLSSAAPSPR